MPQLLSTKEILSVLDSFVNETGMFQEFKDFIERQGYKLEEFGMSEE